MSLPTHKITSLFLRHPEFAKNLLSRNYAFTEAYLHKYRQVIDWGWISANNSIHWTADLIRLYKDKLDFEFFSMNSVAFADVNLLKVLMNEIDWEGSNSGKFFSSSIALNQHIPWTSSLIRKYEHYLNFEHLSNNEKLPWSEQLIDQFQECWDWESIVSNSGIPWTLNLVNKYVDRINFSSKWVAFNLSATDQLDLIEKYSGQLDWRVICSNSKLPWIEENLFKRWKSQLNWYGLATNELLHKDPLFFENNLEKWLGDPFNYFGMLSHNSALPWSAEFIDRFIDFWDWEWLCQNKGVPWNAELIDRFIDKVEWGGRKYSSDGSFRVKGGLISNENLDWTIDFLLRYEKHIDFDELFNDAVWDKAFKPYVDEIIVETIFRLI